MVWRNPSGGIKRLQSAEGMSMTDHLARSFAYEHCDVPEGVLLAEWRVRNARNQRRVRVASGMVAALATLAPAFMSVRATRGR